MTINYISTRGQAPTLGIEDVVLAGLASDGGLYVPESLPQFTDADIKAMAGLPYPELAFMVMRPFFAGAVPDADLKQLIDNAYGSFRHAAIAPVKQLSSHHFLLELFHGPTLAFKDFALQFLGQLLDYLLKKRGQTATIVGATSGDTGSAAIAGCRGRDNLQIYILHPKGRVSDVQRRQMTTVADANVHNIALEGTFDDCQDMVKALFADAAFREKHKLAAVNSINWARILAQVVYYFYAGIAVGSPYRRLSFCVPTGNFGDIYAGYIAARMGLPMERLIIASNRNDILTRCHAQGAYAMLGVQPSLSPSMDIQVSSNFERLLFDLHGRNGTLIREMMERFRTEKTLALSPDVLFSLRERFDAHAVSDAETTATIARYWRDTGELLDPHTAVGVASADALDGPRHIPIITLATAHPAKFPDAVKAACGITPQLPAHMQNLFSLNERYDVLANDIEAVKRKIDGR